MFFFCCCWEKSFREVKISPKRFRQITIVFKNANFQLARPYHNYALITGNC